MGTWELSRCKMKIIINILLLNKEAWNHLSWALIQEVETLMCWTLVRLIWDSAIILGNWWSKGELVEDLEDECGREGRRGWTVGRRAEVNVWVNYLNTWPVLSCLLAQMQCLHGPESLYFTDRQGDQRCLLRFFSEPTKCRQQALSFKIFRQNDQDRNWEGFKYLFIRKSGKIRPTMPHGRLPTEVKQLDLKAYCNLKEFQHLPAN